MWISLIVVCNSSVHRGTKNTMWEGGVKGVGLVHSPLLSYTGYVSDNFFHVTDWLPTLYKAAGGDPASLPKQDGFDMFDMLSSKGPEVR
jgi:arylsulfatase A-like enzyme